MSTVLVRRKERRKPPEMPRGEVLLESPPELPEITNDGFRSVLTYLPMAAGSGAMAFMFLNPNSNPLQMVAGGMMGLSMFGMMFSQVGQKSGERKSKLNAERRDYLRYLGQVRAKVRKAASQQREALEWYNPDPTRLWSIVMSSRLWERRPEDGDFGQVRVGAGPQRLAVQLIAPETKPVEDLEPMSAGALRRFVRTHSTVPALPVAINLRSFSRIFLSGDVDASRAMVRGMIMQMAAFHSPDDLQVSICTSQEQLPHWDWTKWLPHALHPTEHDAAGQVRRIAPTMSELEILLGPEVKDRSRFVAGRPSGELPLHVVVVDGGMASYDSQLAADGIEGVCVIDLGQTVGHTTEGGTLRLNVAADRVHMLKKDRTGKDVPSSIGTPDKISIPQAESLARQLSPFRASASDTTEEEDVLSGNMTLTSLLGVENPYEVDPARVWRPRAQRNRFRVPIGLDADGRPIELDIKESAQGGMGPHGLCIGATGSGKSELLRTLVLGLAMTHGPEILNFVLVDFKGGATFLGMDGLEHVSAIITNLEDELPLVDRMYDALHGEMVRRQEYLRAMGNYASLRDYEKARLDGADLPPMPTLFLVLDEFSELLSAKPDFAELFVMIGRLGRSLGVHLLLASQRLEEGKLRGLDTHLSYRIGLRTFSAMESRVVLGVPDAYELPPAPGNGYLKFATEPMVRFKAAYVSGPVDEQPSKQDTGRQTGQVAAQVVPYLPGYMRPQVIEQPDQPEPEPEENKNKDALFDVVVRQLAGHGAKAHQIWLPPLDDPPPLNEMLPPLQVTHEHGLTTAGWEGRGKLYAMAGIVDKPFHQRRDPYWLELAGAAGHVGIAGGPQSGKSTTIRTLIASLALTHTPAEVQFYCLDFGGGSLAALGDLPHVGGIATRLDADRVRRTVAEVSGLLEQREREFAERGIDGIATYRRMRASGEHPGDGYGDVFLVVDNWLTLRQDYEAMQDTITQLAARGLGYGIHVIASSNKWTEFRSNVRDLFGTKLELRLGDPYESEIDRKLADNVPEGRPGRGLSRDGFHFLTAVPRIDGGGADESLNDGVLKMVQAVSESWTGQRAPQVRMLPDVLPVSDLPSPAETGMRIPIGIDEESLSPVYLDFTQDPHFLVLGDAECGKSNLLRHIATGITSRYTPEQARIIFIDYGRSLLDVANTEHQIGFGASAPAATSLVNDIRGAMMQRLPPADLTPDQLRSRSWWTGADLFLIIDDYEMVATSDNPLRPLVELLPQARDIGLHIILARAMGGAGRGMFDPAITRIKEMASPGLLMSGNKDEGILLGNIKPHKLPPGRGYHIDRRTGTRLIQTAHRNDDPAQ
ncbi:type VII secretion protein EccCa [Actinomadura bangladeshensis]|uniref:Type VII secretion protein EccCa n=1 Tax=Actinomadura bangladeshensis TaxID=453573 RepID=A0A4R4NFH3_9ACTN|nr:type VII secretion protein EccCa [Actinomadura bangladeshensis]TDC05502.1 type VII secretion protein EccCa [Actinomadura bangladeshensis]